MKKALFFLYAGLLFGAPTDDYSVRESQGVVELMTPYGMRAIIGDYLPEGNDSYRVEIPLSELKPPVVLTSPPESKVDKKKKEKVNNLEEEAEEDEWEPEPRKQSKREASDKEAPQLPPQVVVQYDETDRMVLEANRLYNRGKFYESTAVIEELIRRKPNYVRAWIMKGSLMYVQKQKDLARKAWEQALVIEPANLEVKNILEKFK